MPRNFYAGINLNKTELQNAVIQNLATPPASPVTGQIYFNTGDGTLYIWNGTAWEAVGDLAAADILARLLGVDGAGSNLDADLLDGQQGTYYLARANHTGTQTAATISDLTETVQDIVGAQAAGGTGITVVYDDVAGTITISVAFDATVASVNTPGQGSGTGAATVPSRRDHTHGTPTAAAGASAVGDTAAEGAAASLARSDHRHAREAFGAVAAQTAFGAASTNGAAATVARSDHAHGTPTHDTGAHSAIPLSGLAVPTAAVSLNNQKITNLADPTTDTDAANKRYVDGVAAGLDFKASVRAATTTNIALSGVQTIDGVALSAGERVLVKNQTTGTENGIYVVAAGAWTRATDFDTSAEASPGSLVFVEEGTTQADTSWVLSTNGPITLGTTALVWTQFGAAQTFVAGNGLTLAGNTFAVGAGTGITVNADDVAIAAGGVNTTQLADNGVTTAKIADGQVTSAKIADGTITDADISGTAAIAVTKLAGAVRRVTGNVGDGTATAITITHSFGTRDVVVQVYRNSTPWDTVEVDVERPDVNSVTLRFATAPAAAAFRCVIMAAV